MSFLVDFDDVPPLDVWGPEVRARSINGERVTLALVELAPNAAVPEHRHENEQMGMVITGTMTFTVDGETRTLGPGGTWRIPSGRPHDAVAGPERRRRHRPLRAAPHRLGRAAPPRPPTRRVAGSGSTLIADPPQPTEDHTVTTFIEALNDQLAEEYGASQQYIAIAVWYDDQTLPLLAQHFYRQALEERNHAMIIVQYLLDAQAKVVDPGGRGAADRLRGPDRAGPPGAGRRRSTSRC